MKGSLSYKKLRESGIEPVCLRNTCGTCFPLCTLSLSVRCWLQAVVTLNDRIELTVSVIMWLRG